jgi:hypothetical protein
MDLKAIRRLLAYHSPLALFRGLSGGLGQNISLPKLAETAGVQLEDLHRLVRVSVSPDNPEELTFLQFRFLFMSDPPEPNKDDPISLLKSVIQL